jgi:predicted site-specific integrase-resolvase
MKFECERKDLCATEGVECKAFRFWVNNGAMETWSKKEGKMVSIEKDVTRILRIIE